MGALGSVRGNGDLDLALTIRTFAIADGRIHLWVGGGIVWDSEPEAEIEESLVKARAAARRGRRAARGGGAMKLLAVAVAGRGLVDPAEPVFRADDEALLRGRAAFETIRVYGGRRSGSASTSSGSPARPSARAAAPRSRRARAARAQALDGRGAPDAVLRLYWTPARLSALALPSAPADQLERAARAGPTARSRCSASSADAPLAAAGREVHELRGRTWPPRPRRKRRGRRRRALRRRRRYRAGGADLRTSGGARGRRCYTPVARARHPRRRDARDAARARAPRPATASTRARSRSTSSPAPRRSSPRRRSAR